MFFTERIVVNGRPADL